MDRTAAERGTSKGILVASQLEMGNKEPGKQRKGEPVIKPSRVLACSEVLSIDEASWRMERKVLCVWHSILTACRKCKTNKQTKTEKQKQNLKARNILSLSIL